MALREGLLAVLAGVTLGYLLCVGLDARLPSWPFNGAFTPLAVVNLALITVALTGCRGARAWQVGVVALGGASRRIARVLQRPGAYLALKDEGVLVLLAQEGLIIFAYYD